MYDGLKSGQMLLSPCTLQGSHDTVSDAVNEHVCHKARL